MIELVTFILKQFADYPDQLQVTETETESGSVTVTVRASSEDMGKIIGKQGRIAKALRVIVKAASAKDNKRYFVEIKDKEPEAE